MLDNYKNLNCRKCKNSFEPVKTAQFVKTKDEILFKDNSHGIYFEEIGIIEVVYFKCGYTTEYKVKLKND